MVNYIPGHLLDDDIEEELVAAAIYNTFPALRGGLAERAILTRGLAESARSLPEFHRRSVVAGC
jgi:hypothetical protein